MIKKINKASEEKFEQQIAAVEEKTSMVGECEYCGSKITNGGLNGC